jgi:hypothetical protein
VQPDGGDEANASVMGIQELAPLPLGLIAFPPSTALFRKREAPEIIDQLDKKTMIQGDL